MPHKKKIKYLENVKIDNIGYGGMGIGTLEDGRKVIVKGGALPNSVVDIFITRRKKDYVQGHITRVVSHDKKYSDGKIFCDHYFNHLEKLEYSNSECDVTKIGCGGCKWQVMSYTKQLELKENIVLNSFQRILKKQNVDVYSIVASPLEKNYRNKIEFSFGKFITGKDEEKKTLSDWSLGFHKQGEFSKIVDVDRCGLISDKANKIFNYIKILCKKSGLSVHDQMTHKGFWRHLVIREAVNTNQILVNLVVANNELIKDTNKELREKFLIQIKNDEFLSEQITCFFLTQNNGLADTVRGNDIKTKILWGKGFIFEKLLFNQDEVGGKTAVEATFRISPFSFFQTNTYGAQELFGHAAKLVGKVQGNILDLYCGTGTIGLSFLKMGIGEELVGIEIVESAIEDAWKNAEINKVRDNCLFVAGAAEKLVHKLPELKEKFKNTDLIIIDPPREGIHKNVVKFLREFRKERKFKLLYISCNPMTMSRDVELLSADDAFKMRKLQAVDMFPQTHHIEAIGILS